MVFKAEGLVLWLAAVLPYYEKAKADPRLQAAIEARRASLEKNKKSGIEKRAATLVAKRIEAEADDSNSEEFPLSGQTSFDAKNADFPSMIPKRTRRALES